MEPNIVNCALCNATFTELHKYVVHIIRTHKIYWPKTIPPHRCDLLPVKFTDRDFNTIVKEANETYLKPFLIS